MKKFLAWLFIFLIPMATWADDFVPADDDEQNGANTYTLDADDTGGNVRLQFGEALGEFLEWNDANSDFDLSDGLRLDGNLDLQANELIDTRIENLASAPTCDGTNIGRIYFDTGSQNPFSCNGVAWVRLDAGEADFLDEDDFVSDSDTRGATQQSIKAYVDNFLTRETASLADGRYVIEKDGTTTSFRLIFNEFPGGDALFGGPDQVQNVGASQIFSDSVDLLWSPGTTSDGISITDYILQFRENGVTTWTDIVDGVSTDTNHTLAGLTPSTAYDFRVRATNGTSGPFSEVFTFETFPNDPFFGVGFRAMNVGGATTSSVVAFEDTTVITLNGAPLTTLNQGQTFVFGSGQFDVIEGDKPIFVAGETGNDNHVWSFPYLAGSSFSFNTNRFDPQSLFIYAFEDASIELRDGGGALIDSSTLTAGQNDTYSWSGTGSFFITSTGTILPFATSNGPVDQTPLLPAHTQLIGFPSSFMQLTTTVDGTNYDGIHSNSITTANTLDRNQIANIGPQGTTSLYQSESLVISADQPISGASYADSNGSASAPFLPTTFLRTRYAVNVATEYAAFASLQAGTIDVINAAGTVTQTLTLTRSGADVNAPYRARIGAVPGGTRFTATVPVAGWYEPSTNVGAGNDDESILFGVD